VAKKTLIVACFSLLVAMETVYYFRVCAGGLLRLGGERAFFRNDHLSAWKFYNWALAWGADRDRLETDLIELILFGLDQAGVGIRVNLPLPPALSLPVAKKLAARRLQYSPYRAYAWSLVSDVYAHEARLRRRAAVLDLGTLSEGPHRDVLPGEHLALQALETAARLEPLNYTYRALLAEVLLEVGMIPAAAEHCRMGMRAYPDLESHFYLKRPDAPTELIHAALAGMEDALRENSLVPHVQILYRAARLAGQRGMDKRAESYLQRILAAQPEHYDARMEEGLVRYRAGDYVRALEMFRKASRIVDDRPWPFYYAGLAMMGLGDTQGAIESLRKARELGHGELRIFHSLGRVLESHGHIEDAARQFAAAAHHHPESVEAWSALLDFHRRQGNLRGVQDACARLGALAVNAASLRERCATPGENLP
jgi:tetratricopeptide (TPR) repeat protein